MEVTNLYYLELEFLRRENKTHEDFCVLFSPEKKIKFPLFFGGGNC